MRPETPFLPLVITWGRGQLDPYDRANYDDTRSAGVL